MLDERERKYVYKHAYVPEHVPEYVQAISGAEPFLQDGYIVYVRGQYGILIGYPLAEETPSLLDQFQSFRMRFGLTECVVLAQDVQCIPGIHSDPNSVDQYYRLPIPITSMHPQNAYMVRRAGRELSVSEGIFGSEHLALVNDFCKRRCISDFQTRIFSRIEGYLKISPHAKLIEARKGDTLVAYNIVELGSSRNLFYMFNFRNHAHRLPGASDLLFFFMTQMAESHSKDFINLGLGISTGVRRFKEKWGAKPFMRHSVGSIETTGKGYWRRLVDSLLNLGDTRPCPST